MCRGTSRFLHALSGCGRSLLALLFASILICIPTMEALAVRPPLKPMNKAQPHLVAVEARVIAVGTVRRVSQSKTPGGRLETVTIEATIQPEKILKGEKTGAIKIEESYTQYAPRDAGRDTGITAHVAGPAPSVGRYTEGSRVLVFLKGIEGSTRYRPLGSGDHDAYLGVFQITAEGVRSDRYRFDEFLSGYAHSETDFLNLTLSLLGGAQ